MARNRASRQQLELLLTYMEEHTLFARGQITSLGPSGHDKYKDMWKKLSQRLNEFGPSQKNVSQWESSWNKLKLSAKEKKAKYLTALQRTGNESNSPSLSEFDERICKIFGPYGSGLPIIPEVGIYRNSRYSFRDLDGSAIPCVHTTHLVRNSIFSDLQRLHKKEIGTLHNFQESICQSLKKLYSLIDLQIDQQKQRARSNKGQLNFLLAFMERNRAFAIGDIDPDMYAQQWSILATDLNSINGEDRSVEAWQRCWKDQIRLVKDKKEDYLQYRRTQSLTAFDNRVLLAINEELPVRREKKVQPPQETAKRSLNESSEPSTSGVKKLKSQESASALDLMQQQNILLEKLIKEISENYKKQTFILQKGLDKISMNMKEIIDNIIRLFENSKSNENQENVHEFNTQEEDDDNYVEETGSDTLATNDAEDDFPETEYLDESFLCKYK